MLEISKVQFVEKADEFRPNATRIIGGIKMHAGFTVDEYEKIPRKIVHDIIRRHIWHEVYGDLRKPLSELQDYALREVSPQYQHEVQKLCEQISGLLAFNGINDPAAMEERK